MSEQGKKELQRVSIGIRDIPPCKDCTERFLACSDHCPKDERGEHGMETRLETEKVRIILFELLNGCDLYGVEGKEAEHFAHYVAGALDMANAVVEAIVELGGK